jgi:hypothetical protein
MQLNDIKSLIADTGFKRDKVKVREAWIAYGGMLAQCPHKQGAKIGQWVRDQGLDFVESRQERTAALALWQLTDGNCRQLNLDACPYSRPTHILKWLRAQERQDVKPNDEGEAETDTSVSSKPEAISPEARFSAAITELRNAFRALPSSHITKLTAPLEGNSYEFTLSKPANDAVVTWADGVTLPAIVKGAVLDVRISFADFDVETRDDISGFIVTRRT